MFDLRHEDMGDGVAVLHCTVSEWSMLVARLLDEKVSSWFDELASMGYHTGITFSPNPRFCEYMGGERIGEVEWEGVNYEIFTWDLKQQQ